MLLNTAKCKKYLLLWIMHLKIKSTLSYQPGRSNTLQALPGTAALPNMNSDGLVILFSSSCVFRTPRRAAITRRGSNTQVSIWRFWRPDGKYNYTNNQWDSKGTATCILTDGGTNNLNIRNKLIYHMKSIRKIVWRGSQGCSCFQIFSTKPIPHLISQH